MVSDHLPGKMTFTDSVTILETRINGMQSQLQEDLGRKKINLLSCSSLKSINQFIPSLGHTNLFFSLRGSRKASCSKRALVIQLSYSYGGRPSSVGIFIGGFVLGGLMVETLSCVYAPQISKTLDGADKKDLMKKLPKFIYDEEKALEKQYQKLAEKIEQLNFAIDNVSTQLRSDDPPNGAAINSDEVESVV
ncbi:uncharacterized protein LOC111392273 [Olea europaea var. sylvestris]|uniref:uncharacterized protein LOC111392273 n=1 Tax=Olea europaea var. sylvestris TaxID=158386 RepID=UPI000C1D55B3|nr:uncharacterized protein LOC111392273 [Olea europaea var. sylvestris]